MYGNIIDAIQDKVDEIAKDMYGDREDGPTFEVSVYHGFGNNGKITNHQIILTIDNGHKHSRPLFPRLDYEYGYECLREEIKYLYNSTM